MEELDRRDEMLIQSILGSKDYYLLDQFVKAYEAIKDEKFILHERLGYRTPYEFLKSQSYVQFGKNKKEELILRLRPVVESKQAEQNDSRRSVPKLRPPTILPTTQQTAFSSRSTHPSSINTTESFQNGGKGFVRKPSSDSPLTSPLFSPTTPTTTPAARAGNSQQVPFVDTSSAMLSTTSQPIIQYIPQGNFRLPSPTHVTPPSLPMASMGTPLSPPEPQASPALRELRRRLVNLGKKLGLPPPEHIRKSVKTGDLFVHTIKIGDKKYGSLGAYSDQFAAEEAATKNALVGLTKMAAERDILTDTSSMSPDDHEAETGSQVFSDYGSGGGSGQNSPQRSEEMCQRIHSMLQENRQGLLSTFLENKYQERYHEPLPEEWVRIISEQGLIELNHVNKKGDDYMTIVALKPDYNEFENWELNRLPGKKSRTSKIKFAETVDLKEISTESHEDEQDTPEPVAEPQPPSLLKGLLSANVRVQDVESIPPFEFPELPEPTSSRAAARSPPGYVAEVTKINSPADFYFRISDSAFDRIVSEMTSFYGKGHGVELDSVNNPPELLGLYAAYHHEQWHRVYITNLLPDSPQEAQVSFVDTGEIDVIGLSDLRILSTAFIALPRQAICARLNGFTSKSLNEFEQSPKLQELTERFEILAQSLELGNPRIKPSSEDLNEIPLPVDLWVPVENKDNQNFWVSVNEVLAELLGRGSGAEKVLKDLHALSVNQGLNNGHHQHNNGHQVASGSSGPSIPPGFESVDVVLKPYTDKIPSIACDMEVLVSSSESPGSFWVQPIVEQQHLAELKTNLILRMDSAMSEAKNKKVPVSGDFCAVYRDDGTWFRAFFVKSVGEPKNFAIVFYVDYGEVGLVPKANVRALDLDLGRLPMLAIACKLYGVRPPISSGQTSSSPVPESWPKFSCQKFNNAVVGVSFKARIHAKAQFDLVTRIEGACSQDAIEGSFGDLPSPRSSPRPQLNFPELLVSLVDKNGSDIAQLLVQSGTAVVAS